MEVLSHIADAMRKMSEAYGEALLAMTKAVESLPQPSSEAQRRMAEQWLSLARMGKDGVVTALNQGFELWERECRRTLGASPSTESLGNPMEAWAENWKKTLDAFVVPGTLGDAWSEVARNQAELVQQTLQGGLRAWQQLWQTTERKP